MKNSLLLSIIAFSLQVMFLSSCDISPGNSAESPVQSGEGSILIQLPDMSVLAKGAVDSLPPDVTDPAILELTVTGKGMFPINRSYDFDSLSTTILINRVAAGTNRIVTGRLIDSVGNLLQHGSDTVDIFPNQTNYAHLQLRYHQAGSLVTCVEIEGLENPNGFEIPNLQPADPNLPVDSLLGTWHVEANSPGLNSTQYQLPHMIMEFEVLATDSSQAESAIGEAQFTTNASGWVGYTSETFTLDKGYYNQDEKELTILFSNSATGSSSRFLFGTFEVYQDTLVLRSGCRPIVILYRP